MKQARFFKQFISIALLACLPACVCATQIGEVNADFLNRQNAASRVVTGISTLSAEEFMSIGGIVGTKPLFLYLNDLKPLTIEQRKADPVYKLLQPEAARILYSRPPIPMIMAVLTHDRVLEFIVPEVAPLLVPRFERHVPNEAYRKDLIARVAATVEHWERERAQEEDVPAVSIGSARPPPRFAFLRWTLSLRRPTATRNPH